MDGAGHATNWRRQEQASSASWRAALRSIGMGVTDKNCAVKVVAVSLSARNMARTALVLSRTKGTVAYIRLTRDRPPGITLMLAVYWFSHTGTANAIPA